MEIHIQLAGVQLGPYSEKQIREYVADGLLSMTDKARIDGSLEWIPVDVMLTKLPPPEEPAPAPNPDSIFIDAEPLPSEAPADPPTEAAVGIVASAVRPAEERKDPESDPFTAKTKPLGTAGADQPGEQGQEHHVIEEREHDRAAVAGDEEDVAHGAGQGAPEQDRTAAGPLECRRFQRDAAHRSSRGCADRTGNDRPMASNVTPEITPPPAMPASRKGAGLPSLLKALPRKRFRCAGPHLPARTRSRAGPIRAAGAGGLDHAVTTPMPTKLIMNPSAIRANRKPGRQWRAVPTAAEPNWRSRPRNCPRR